ncbi:MAG: N-acetylmuramoyl-L-alanine amidase [Thermacetogenium sp.]|nr:N-acetylmuramoyl-L-alanine amidase [Thermacetogenium sp.]
MSKLYTNRPLLGNIGLVVFLAFLVTLTFGTVPQAEAQTVVPEYDGNLDIKVTPDNPLAVQALPILRASMENLAMLFTKHMVLFTRYIR